jgi:hypothetical protein
MNRAAETAKKAAQKNRRTGQPGLRIFVFNVLPFLPNIVVFAVLGANETRVLPKTLSIFRMPAILRQMTQNVLFISGKRLHFV